MLRIIIVLLCMGSLHSLNAGDWVKLGTDALGNQDYQAAITFFSYQLEENPKDAYAYYLRSRAYLIDGQLLQSSEDLMQAYKIDPVMVETLQSRESEVMKQIPPKSEFEIIDVEYLNER